MKNLAEIITEDMRTVAVAGHVNPDGDCVGSCTAVWQYLRKLRHFDRVDLYLEEPRESLLFLKGMNSFLQTVRDPIAYDLFICLDVSDYRRIGVAAELFDRARVRVAIDHHVSNSGFADINHVVSDASSCAEVLCSLMDFDLIDEPIAESLYTGIIHDSGVFQYQNTTPDTMRAAARLMEKGIPFYSIIDDSFNRVTFLQNRILGYCLGKAKSELGGKCITSALSLQEQREQGVVKADLDGIVAQLRLTKGTEAAIFAYETEPGLYKLSLRSNGLLDVQEICSIFGGGGHLRAAGCLIRADAEEAVGMVLGEIRKRLSCI